MAYVRIGQAAKDERAMQEMDQEELIENVRACEALYAIAHAKYTDIRFKENAWRAIGKNMGQTAIACKKTWTNLRDSFRRALRKRMKTRNGRRTSTKIKKWKFEDEMSFLIPHLQERETMNINLEKDIDDNNDYEDDEENDYNCAANNDDRKNDRDDYIEIQDQDRDEKNVDESDDNNSHVEKLRRKNPMNEKVLRQMNRNKSYNLESEPAVFEYLFGDKQNANLQPRDREPNGIDMFFSSIAITVKNFSSYYQNIAKSKIFNIITDLEMKQIIQGQQAPVQLCNTSTQHRSDGPISTTTSTEILESYRSGPYDECSAQSVPPSIIAYPSPSSSQNISNSVPMVFHNESIKNE